MEKLLLLIKVLLSFFGKRKERITIPKRLTEEEIDTNPVVEFEETVLIPKPVPENPKQHIWVNGEKCDINWGKQSHTKKTQNGDYQIKI